MVYDSSARQVFFYNLQARRFENIDVSDFVSIDNICVRNPSFSDPDIFVVANEGWGHYEQGFLLKDGKKMALGDLEEFSNIRVNNGYAVITSKYTKPTQIDVALENQVCWVEQDQSFIMYNGAIFTFAKMSLASDIYDINNAKFLFFRKGYRYGNESYFDDNEYIYSIFSKDYNSFIINPDTGDITFTLGFNGFNKSTEETIQIWRNGAVLATYNLNELIEQGFLKPATVPFSAPLHAIEKETDSQEQMGEPMAATVNERIEFNMDDIKKMVLEAFNNIKKNGERRVT